MSRTRRRACLDPLACLGCDSCFDVGYIFTMRDDAPTASRSRHALSEIVESRDPSAFVGEHNAGSTAESVADLTFLEVAGGEAPRFAQHQFPIRLFELSIFALLTPRR